MSSKQWIELAIKKPTKTDREENAAKAGKRARLAETLLKMRQEKG
jgi:hypothetical protein